MFFLSILRAAAYGLCGAAIVILGIAAWLYFVAPDSSGFRTAGIACGIMLVGAVIVTLIWLLAAAAHARARARDEDMPPPGSWLGADLAQKPTSCRIELTQGELQDVLDKMANAPILNLPLPQRSPPPQPPLGPGVSDAALDRWEKEMALWRATAGEAQFVATPGPDRFSDRFMAATPTGRTQRFDLRHATDGVRNHNRREYWRGRAQELAEAGNLVGAQTELLTQASRILDNSTVRGLASRLAEDFQQFQPKALTHVADPAVGQQVAAAVDDLRMIGASQIAQLGDVVTKLLDENAELAGKLVGQLGELSAARAAFATPVHPGEADGDGVIRGAHYQSGYVSDEDVLTGMGPARLLAALGELGWVDPVVGTLLVLPDQPPPPNFN
jgi:hypothetical protein